MSDRQPPPSTVRFDSTEQEIPSEELENTNTLSHDESHESLSEEAKEELRSLAMSLQKSRMQAARMDQFVFDPVSLPPSRVPSGSSANLASSSAGLSPKMMSRTSSVTPPLTPAVSDSKDGKPNAKSGIGSSDAMPVTPQISPGTEPTTPPVPGAVSNETRPSAAAKARLDARPKSMTDVTGAISALPKQSTSQVVGPKGDSQPPSQTSTPASTPRDEVPSGAQSPYIRPFTPAGDPNDPYSRSKRAPQPKSLEAIDPRFVFFTGKERPKSQTIPTSPVAPTSPEARDEKRPSIFSIPPKPHHHHHHQGGSMSELKRFFKIGGHKKEKRDKSPAAAPPSPKIPRTGFNTPPSRQSSISLPFADDHGLESKYGKFEKMLGSGAGGSVRLMKRNDGVTFAVKQFRQKHAYESERDYNKKVTAEFCIGSTLHHGNVIEAMDILNEKGRWYEVMEYAPFDLFASVMTGKMSREEVACCTMQILSGLSYLHGMGLAHRDMKLDNVVVNEKGIMKIIDFGSAFVFQYPFENDIVLATGIVGSDPYLAPEVYDSQRYDPQKVDVWSLAIIFCCMSLRRFPWKCPRISDNSYKLFVTQPTDEELRSNVYPQKPRSEPTSRQGSINPTDASAENDGNEGNHQHRHRHRHHPQNSDDTDNASSRASAMSSSAATAPVGQQGQQSQVIKGSWRLLRLLPRETRSIVGRMLEVDPAKRATLEEVQADPWVKRTSFCRQEVGGETINVEGHTHVLEAGGTPTPTPSENKQKK